MRPGVGCQGPNEVRKASKTRPYLCVHVAKKLISGHICPRESLCVRESRVFLNLLLRVNFTFLESQVPLVVKNHTCQCRKHEIRGPSWVGMIPRKGNGNPLQYSCLGNPMDRGAWQTVVHRITQSRTRLKRLIVQEFVHFV